MNASNIIYIGRVLLHNYHFGHCTTLRRLMSALLEPPRTRKRNTIMSLAPTTYFLLLVPGHSVVQLKQLRLRWTAHKNMKLSTLVEYYHVTNAVQRVHISQLLLVAPKNNAVDVLMEELQQGIPVFDEQNKRWVNVAPIFRRVGHDDIKRIA